LAAASAELVRKNSVFEWQQTKPANNWFFGITRGERRVEALPSPSARLNLGEGTQRWRAGNSPLQTIPFFVLLLVASLTMGTAMGFGLIFRSRPWCGSN
jgi:hypothetical protein